MASFGNIERFNVNDSKSWDSYKERLDFYLTANDITDAGKKKAVFLSICGPATYDIIRSLIAPMKKKHSKQKPKVNQQSSESNFKNVPQNEHSSEDQVYHFSLNNVKSDSITGKYLVDVLLNKKPIRMEIDSGAGYSIIFKSTFQKLFMDNPPKVKPCNLILLDYQNQLISTIGECYVNVQRGQKSATLPVIVTEGNRRNKSDKSDLVKEYLEVLESTLGKFKGPPVSFSSYPNIKPIVLKVRKIPFALKDKIDRELDRLVDQGVLEPVTHPKRATPIVVVAQDNGDGTALAGGKIFAKLDMAQAYLQLSVDQEAADAQTIITHKGPFRSKRLQFGVSVAPQIFQRFMDMRLTGIPGVLPYYDDILIVGHSETDLDRKVREVLTRFREDGLNLRRDKCIFHTKSIEFLGFSISAEGIRPTKEKVKAIVNAPAPTNKTELQAFLGLINFYHVFLEDKATIANPLHDLLHKGLLAVACRT
ncbi:uncharacterized protein K02A2.6-like [Cylas formicarius]|uniref:uncharacterized protein K02A2.6-like n=1 Tax=Cylas formicarius TaxID=197179 RepID=UPI002958378F|nr:uncharacterized protein K02A2.6-like [Cylas formicarius]